MTSLPANRAKTLKEAYRACDVKPLTGENMARYYVELSAVPNTEAIEGVSTDLDIHEPGVKTHSVAVRKRISGDLQRIRLGTRC
jgi:hypothetical protein